MGDVLWPLLKALLALAVVAPLAWWSTRLYATRAGGGFLAGRRAGRYLQVWESQSLGAAGQVVLLAAGPEVLLVVVQDKSVQLVRSWPREQFLAGAAAAAKAGDGPEAAGAGKAASDSQAAGGALAQGAMQIPSAPRTPGAPEGSWAVPAGWGRQATRWWKHWQERMSGKV